jgi:hypothetical protein
VQNNSIILDLIVNLKKNKQNSHRTFHLKETMTATKIDSSHESGKNFITWAWPASTTICTYRVIHERGISEFLFAATHYTHCNNILISNFENNYD